MIATKLSCPSCGASITTDENTAFCPYCGSKITFGESVTINKNIKLYKRYTNDADVIRAKNEELENKRDHIGFIIGIVFIVMIIIVGVSALLIHDYNEQQREHAEQQRIDEAIAQGKIAVCYNYDDFTDIKYQAVKAQLEAVGFTNFTLIDLGEDGFLWSNTDKVKSVSIAGKSSFHKNDYFFPDDKIIITYY